jgi:glucose-6-phosphate isomerase
MHQDSLRSPLQVLALATGVFDGRPPLAIRTISELGSIFANREAVLAIAPETVVYEIHGEPTAVDEPARLLYATTILFQGRVDNEFFMTRGHFHTKPERGEFMVTLSGQGALILMDRARDTWSEPMSKGSVHNIDGHLAHRVANTGEVPLVFLVVWMSDCGHDYESISATGFGKILIAGANGPALTSPSGRGVP